MRVLLIEDDQDLGGSIARALAEEGYTVEWARSGDQGLYNASEYPFDLVILDRLLPGLDGMDVLRKLRAKKAVPILMLTALDNVLNRVEGLEAGADDYLGKPFELNELFARIKALLRRQNPGRQETLCIGNVMLNPFSREITVLDQPVHLSKTEYAATELLMRKQGAVVTREELEALLYEDKDISANPLEVVIHRIRQKLGKDFIQTRRGVGYFIPRGTNP